MEPIDHRLREIEQKVEALSSDLRVLRSLVAQDHGSALNKIRYVTEKVLHGLCVRHEVSWGKAEPTLENMIGPLIARGVIPKNVGVHVRTVQTNASPGSHYQDAPLSDAHVQLALLALLEFLEWQHRPSEPVSVAPGTRAAARRRKVLPVLPALIALAGFAVAVGALYAKSRSAARQTAGASPAASEVVASPGSAAPPASLARARAPEIGLRALDAYREPSAASLPLLDSVSYWQSAQLDFDRALLQAEAPQRWRSGAMLARGQVALDQGEYVAAAAAFREAIVLEPEWAPGALGLSTALSREGKYPEALAAARDAERLDPNWVRAVWNLGRVHARGGKLDEAIAEYRRALTLAPKSALVLADLALALHASRLDSEVDRVTKRALELEPELASVHLLLAERALERGDAKAALDEASAVLSSTPANVPARLAEADALSLLGRAEEARMAYARAIADWEKLGGAEEVKARLALVREAMKAGKLPPPPDAAPKPFADAPPRPRSACPPGVPLCN